MIEMNSNKPRPFSQWDLLLQNMQVHVTSIVVELYFEERVLLYRPGPLVRPETELQYLMLTSGYVPYKL